MFAGLQDPSAAASAAGYYPYSAIVTLAALVFSLYMTSAANAQAEQQLRRDIEERLRAERELAESRQASIYSAKMAALGEMSGNIGHEINNPLAAILLRAQRLQRLAAKDKLDLDIVRGAARDIQATVDRIRRIVDALRSFARDAEADPMRPESVQAIVTETHRAVRAALPTTRDRADRRTDRARPLRRLPQRPDLAGVAEPAGQRARRGRVPRCSAACASWPRATNARCASRSATAGPASRATCTGASWSRSSPPRSWARGPASASSVSKGIAEAHGGRLVFDAGARPRRGSC